MEPYTMRKPLTFWIVALVGLCLVATGAQSFWQSRQQVAISAGGGRTCTDDTASTNFLARLTGSPSNTLKDAYCNAIKYLESVSIITANLSGSVGCSANLDVLVLTTADTQANSLLNICGTSWGGTAVNSISFAAFGGFTGNGTNSYIDTGYNPTSVALAYAASSSSLGACILNSRTTGDIGRALAANSSGSAIFHSVVAKFTDNNAYTQANGSTASAANVTNAQGLVAGRRTSATALELWRAGALDNTTANATGGLPTNTFFALAISDNGTPMNFYADTIGAYFLGSGALNMANMKTAISTFITAVGASGC
jgi:hypothetical protein